MYVYIYIDIAYNICIYIYIYMHIDNVYIEEKLYILDYFCIWRKRLHNNLPIIDGSFMGPS